MKRLTVTLFAVLGCLCVGSVFAGNGAAYESFDSPSEIVLPDCSTVDVSTSFHSVDPLGETIELVVNNFQSKNAADETMACDGEPCDDSLDDFDDMEIGAVSKRNDKNENATPSNGGGKGSTTISCVDCPDDTVDALVGASSKKNSHFDIDLEDGNNGNAFVCKVGLQTHQQEDDDVL